MTDGRPRAIRIAILAMGGEGGGVLADWLVDLAEHGGFIAQMTSVPGVAQRTGATIYYVELFPKAAAEAAGQAPVLALMPVPGDVDIVIASELMEAGRAVQRGFVTPDRTTLIASTHRVFAMTEKLALDDGRVDETALREACRTAAQRYVAFDMAAVAERTGSVVSAVMFGALAGAKALPFERAAFEATIARGKVGAAASTRAFGEAFAISAGEAPAPVLPAAVGATAPEAGPPFGTDIAQVPPPARAIVATGAARLVDYQDEAYARLYLDRLSPIAAADAAHGDGSHRLLAETARHLALGMSYEDTIRVAELKIRPSRFARVAAEVKLKDGQVLEIAEFLHPRLQEIAETVPAPLGRALLKDGPLRRIVERLTDHGRIVRTTTIFGFLQLYAVAALKPWRRKSLRYAAEQAELERWLASVAAVAARNYDLAVELAECRNLVKGYGDTHARGRASFERIMALIEQIAARPQPAITLSELRKAALADETGKRLTETAGRLGLA